MVGCDVGCGINRRKFVLGGGDFVMLGFCKDAEFPKFVIEIRHKLLDARFDRAEIMVVEFLTFRGFRAEKGASCENQILAFCIQILIDKEVFLLGADGRTDVFRVVSEKFQNTKSLFVKCFH